LKDIIIKQEFSEIMISDNLRHYPIFDTDLATTEAMIEALVE
jgi:hypothetical protein